MTRTMRHLLNKLPKKTLIETIIQVYENLFTDPEERKTAFREMALLIQAREVVLGNSELVNFSEPFKTDLQIKIAEICELSDTEE